ncbi:J domain-containing protein [Chitinophaga nivalis]|uniref:DnaJ domain-containing protein n=1 Tax=Chitinophaga nivalis TaxID=2991709 RepID=A0ABT3IQX8_9BACT|nr:J domain-containing protein [Chitinophaga nivalis]MCW3463923.1 DnaJ domain-containing protein [Chitinophaga nivalis]MCW3486387.1 DnaJ domain-containing protein [Chitinophaga nivalis]
MINYYEVLEIADFSSHEVIKAAYRKLSKRYHPDVNNGDKVCEERFKEIQQAYEQLRNPNTKALQDDWLRNGQLPEDDAADTPPGYHPPSYEYESDKRWTTWAPMVLTGLLVLVCRMALNWGIEWRRASIQQKAVPVVDMSTILQRAAAPGNQLPVIKAGDTHEQVQQLQGNPDEVKKYGSEEVWYYHNSLVNFKKGIVISYLDTDGVLKVRENIKVHP